MKAAIPIRKVFREAERVAVAELLELATVCSTSPKRAIKAMGALCVQRAANIMRQKARPLCFSNGDLSQFIVEWNKAPGPRRKAKR